jgi:hypothetical protein
VPQQTAPPRTPILGVASRGKKSLRNAAVDHTKNKPTSLESRIKEYVNRDFYIGPRLLDAFKEGHKIKQECQSSYR